MVHLYCLMKYEVVLNDWGFSIEFDVDVYEGFRVLLFVCDFDSGDAIVLDTFRLLRIVFDFRCSFQFVMEKRKILQSWISASVVS